MCKKYAQIHAYFKKGNSKNKHGQKILLTNIYPNQGDKYLTIHDSKVIVRGGSRNRHVGIYLQSS